MYIDLVFGISMQLVFLWTMKLTDNYHRSCSLLFSQQNAACQRKSWMWLSKYRAAWYLTVVHHVRRSMTNMNLVYWDHRTAIGELYAPVYIARFIHWMLTVFFYIVPVNWWTYIHINHPSTYIWRKVIFSCLINYLIHKYLHFN